MVLAQELPFTWDILPIIITSRDSEFQEKGVNQIMKTGYVLLQVKCYSHWNHRSVNKLKWMLPVKLPGFPQCVTV